MLQHRMTHATLGEVLRWRAQTQPERRAFTFLADGESLEQQISYAGLDRQARAIATTLQAQGFAGGRALLLFPAGLSFLAAFMGCVYARVTAIPVPAHFQDPTRLQRTLPRLRAIAADAGAGLVLTIPEMLAQTGLILEQAPDLATLRWLDTEAIPLLLAESWQPPEIQPDDLVFLQYSSGSTGLPKGVMVCHANLMHNLAAISRAFGHSEASTGVSWLPAYHDMGLVADVLQPLYAGFHQVFMSPFDFIRRPLRWLEAISRYRASTSGAPNFAYALCTAKVQEEELTSLDLSAWEIAYNCAEPVSAEVIERFAATFATCGFRRRAFFPYLGMAEATLMVSAGAKDAEPVFLPVSRTALQQGRIETVASGTAASGTAQDARLFVGCGKSLPDQRIAIVDPLTRLACAEKQIGEIWVSGPSVARGYWNRPDENRALFEARLADTGEGPFMRTGDLGFLADSELFITGRLKDLIIIQGQNHYPQDLESTVDAAHPLIRPGCCAAFALGEDPEELVIVAELLPDSGLAPAEQTVLLKRIAASVQGELFAAHQLTASRIVLIETGTIPKTSSGKIQRKACKEAFLRHELRILAELGRSDLEQELSVADGLPAGTALEDTLCGLFADILGLARVGPQERFLDLGGHSLLATKLVSRIRESLGVELPLRLLFETPTVASLAARIAGLEGQSLPPIHKLSHTAPLRLSYAQERMWFMDQLQPDRAIYNIPTLIRLEGLLDASALEKGFQTLIGRHASLRTRFESRADQVFQIVDARSNFRLEIVDLYDLVDAETEARHLAEAEAHAPFDLAHGPLIRARLLKIRSDLHLLVLNLHHIISDGWSQGLLLQELAACYAAFCRGEAAVLQELPVQYADYAHWQRQNLEGEAFQTQLSYWKGCLENAPALLQLPTDRPRPAVESYQGASFSFRCERALTEALQGLARREDVTLFMLLLAAFQVLLHRYSRQGDICVGIPIANRRMREIEPLIGFFVNTLVIRGDLQAAPAFRDFLRQIKAHCLDAYAHQDLPFEKLVEELNPERSLSHHPLFQVMFVLQDAAMASLQLPGLESSRAELSGPVSKFDLTLELIPEHDGLSGRIEYNRDLFDEATIVRLAGHYLQLLQAIIDQPEKPVSSLTLLTEAERKQLLFDWNDTSTEYQRDTWVHRLFEEQTARTPERTALLWAGQRLSYRELNEKANRLAHFLHGRGLGPGMLAGICLERSPDLIAGLLAILKLGAAYVPIDPDYPADRIAWILADAAPTLVLSRRSLATQHGLSGLVVDLDAHAAEIAREAVSSPEFM
ncbi:MAG: condensation domain-containing protein, partial [Candidatus Sericytochromatia bacterium]